MSTASVPDTARFRSACMVLSCMVWIGRGPPETVQAEGNSGRVRAVDRDLVGKARGPGRVHTVIGVGSEKFWGLLERGARNSGGCWRGEREILGIIG